MTHAKTTVDQINYQNSNGVVVETTRPAVDLDHASVLAQKHMGGNADLVSAHVLYGNIEKVVSKATSWQKANG